MPYITEDSGICLSSSGKSSFSACGPIVRESDRNYVFTEDELKIYTDNACSDSIAKFSCSFDRNEVDQRFVTITNSCSLPIEITGFINSDPDRFSLFEYPKYRNIGPIYSYENTEQLPVTLNPSESLQIPTFFHPSAQDMQDANAGLITDVNNQETQVDGFGAKIEIYPGFPISNCSDNQESCDAYFTLTGTFLCDYVDRDWMNNLDNYMADGLPVGFSELDIDVIRNDACISRTPLIEFQLEAWQNDSELIQGLKKSVDSYSDSITNGGKNLSEIYGHIGMHGALEGLSKMTQSKASIDELINSSLSNEQVLYNYDGKDYSMTVNYDSQKNSIKNIDGVNFTGFFYDIIGDLGARNQTVFINIETDNQQGGGLSWVDEFVAIADEFESQSATLAGSFANKISDWEVKYSDKITPGTYIFVGIDCLNGNSSWTYSGYTGGRVFGQRGGQQNWGSFAERVAMTALAYEIMQCGNGGSVIRKYADALVDHFGSSGQGIVSIFTADEGNYNNLDFCPEEVAVDEDELACSAVNEFVAIADRYLNGGSIQGGLSKLISEIITWEHKYIDQLRLIPIIMVNSVSANAKWDPSLMGLFKSAIPGSYSDFSMAVLAYILISDSPLYVPKKFANALVDHYKCN